MKIKLSSIFIFLTLTCYSQFTDNPLFEEGSRICFVGNSITHGGGFHHNIMLYQMTRFPEQEVTFFNCGIGGNQAHDILARMESDILVHQPTHAVIMLGMNDVHRNLYGNYLTEDPDTLRMREEAINTYENNMDSIVRAFLSRDIKVLIQKPTIYDQTALMEAKNYSGTNDALEVCVGLNDQLASKYDLPIVDYWTVMDEINREIQKEDPSATIVGKDRVHPGSTGHLIMAYQFLKDMNAPGYVSKIVVDKNRSKLSEQCLNCNVEPVHNDMSGGLRFRVTEGALPFPVSDDQREGMDLVPFMEEFNTELLQVSGLKRGQYQLKIDDVVIGSFSSQQLTKGINLAEFENTPQNSRAAIILGKLQELWELEGKLRDMKFVEFSSYYREYTGNRDDLKAFQAYYLERISSSPWRVYNEYVLKRYMENKPKQKEYEDQIVRIREEAYQLVQPVSHHFEICSLAQSIYHEGWIDFNKNNKKDVFEDPSQAVEKRIKDLLGQMTVEEKTNQCATLYGYRRVLKDELPTPDWKSEIWKDGIANFDEHLNGLKETQYSYPYSRHAEAINTVQKWFVEETRLGIPVDFTNEGIHGLNHDRATPLPAPISIGSTWDKDLVLQAGEIVGREAKALGYTNVYAPILDLARDPRWGRVVECYGEDPFLVASLGQQMVEGIQSRGVASTLKHYAVYSIPKGGRDGNARTDPHVAPREMHQLFLYPYRKIVGSSHPMGVMSSYNDWDGVPVSASYYFLTELLRQQYGFKGYVVSDSWAVECVVYKHHVAKDEKDAVRQVAEAGLNVRTNFTPPEDFILPLRELVSEGKVSMSTLDRNVADVLRVKFELGLFDSPYVEDTKAADQIVASPDTEDFVLKMARESLVLLKNENDLLPLDLGSLEKILVTGPLATDETAYISRYGPQNLEISNVLEGIQNYVGKKARVEFVLGCEVVDETWPESEIIPSPLTNKEKRAINEAVEEAEKSDVIIAVLGEDEKRCGEGKSRTGLGLPGRQLDLLMALKKTGKPIVLVLINGQPLTINWENRNILAILEAWFPNAAGGTAIAETLFGENNPGGKLPLTFPKSLGQIELNFPFKPSSHAGQASSGDNGYGNTSVIGALYPFGYGLSYTTFEYKNLKIEPLKNYTRGQVHISLDVENTGDRKGDEVVQLYVRDLVSSVTTYESVLRGFERVTLEPGEIKTLQFTLKPEDLELLDRNMEWVVEPGMFEIQLGASSEDIRLSGKFELLENNQVMNLTK